LRNFATACHSSEDGDLSTSHIDIEEHPVKLEDQEEQNDSPICGLPVPDTADQKQGHDIGKFLSLTMGMGHVSKTPAHICLLPL
jgi:hypothetical protein